MKIRRMELKDLYDVLRICNQSFLEMARWTSRIAPMIIESIRKYPELQLVAEEDGKIIGFLRGGYIENGLKVLHIAVHPSYQRRGIGSALISKFEEIAQEKNLKRIALDTPFAKRFYEKIGYKCISIEYALIYEVLGKEIDDVENVEEFKLEHIPYIIKDLGKYSFDFLMHFFKVYESDPDKSFIYIKNSKVVGGTVSGTNTWNSDLVEIKYLIAKDNHSKERLLKKVAYRASLQGSRWIGYKTRSREEYMNLIRKGWREAQLPYWWTRYEMEKMLS